MLVRRIARLLLATPFVVEGVRTLRTPPADHEPLPAGLGSRVPYLPDDTRTVLRATGGAQAGAAVLLATGRAPRLASLVLAATLVPSTAASHRFWEEKDPQARNDQLGQFTKNVGLAGGLLVAAADTEGRPGLGWRVRRARRDGGHAVRASRREARLVRRAAGAKAGRTAGRSVDTARQARWQARKAQWKAQQKAQRRAQRARAHLQG